MSLQPWPHPPATAFLLPPHLVAAILHSPNTCQCAPFLQPLSRRAFLHFFISTAVALPLVPNAIAAPKQSYDYDIAVASKYETLDGSTRLTRGLGLDALRAQLLAEAYGQVLEIGFGTGVNLPFYVPSIEQNKLTSLTALDSSDAMLQYGQSKYRTITGSATNSDSTFKTLVADASNTHLPPDSFDTIVATFCLCVVSDVSQVAKEMYRLIRKGGNVLILDYTRSQESQPVALYQDLTSTLVTKMSKGCSPNLDINAIMADSGFSVKSSSTILAGTIIAAKFSPNK